MRWPLWPPLPSSAPFTGATRRAPSLSHPQLISLGMTNLPWVWPVAAHDRDPPLRAPPLHLMTRNDSSCEGKLLEILGKGFVILNVICGKAGVKEPGA